MRRGGSRTGGLGTGTGSEDSAGDGAGLFQHLASVLFGGYVPQIHGGQSSAVGVELGGEEHTLFFEHGTVSKADAVIHCRVS